MRRLACIAVAAAGALALALATLVLALPSGAAAVSFPGRPDLDAVAAAAKVPTPPGTLTVVAAECPTRVGENGACVDLTQAADPTLYLPPNAYGADEKFAVM